RDIEARHIGQQHVQQDDVGSKSADSGDRGRTVVGVADDEVTRGLEELASKPPEARMVVDDERGRWHGFIVPQLDRRNLLDFPELSRSQGKARRLSLCDFLPSPPWSRRFKEERRQ